MTQPTTNLRPMLSTEPGIKDGATPQERTPLWALVDQVKDISGEIAIAVEMLESDDPAEVQTAIDLVNTYLDASNCTKDAFLAKADNVAGQVMALRRTADFQAQLAQEEHDRLMKRSASNNKSADRLLHYLTTQLRRVEPDAKRFPLARHDITSRAGSVKTVVDEKAVDSLPEEFLYQPPTPPVPKPRPDLKAIKAALKQGREVPGARLVEGERTWDVK